MKLFVLSTNQIVTSIPFANLAVLRALRFPEQ
jgi:hypothetical protein